MGPQELTSVVASGYPVATILSFSVRVSRAILGFEWDLPGIALVITAIGGLIVGLVGGWFTFVRDNTKRLDDRDLAILKHQANRVDAQMDRYEKEILYLRERQSRDSQRIDQLMLELDLANKRIDELEHENAALRGL